MIKVKSVDDVVNASVRVKAFLDDYNRTPLTVNVGGETVTRATFNRMMCATVLEIESKRMRNILLTEVSSPMNPVGRLNDGRFEHKEYLDIASRFNEWIIKNNYSTPNFVNTKLGMASSFNIMDMFSRILAFYKNKGVLPNYVVTQRDGGESEVVHVADSVKALQDALKVKFDSARGLFEALKKVPYSDYYNSRYNQFERLNRISRGLGLNCTDICLESYDPLTDMGYMVKAVRGEVLCSSGKWYGHVWLEIRGKELTIWTFFDPVSAMLTGNPFGSLFCTKGLRNRTYNPKWFMDLL